MAIPVCLSDEYLPTYLGSKFELHPNMTSPFDMMRGSREYIWVIFLVYTYADTSCVETNQKSWLAIEILGLCLFSMTELLFSLPAVGTFWYHRISQPFFGRFQWKYFFYAQRVLNTKNPSLNLKKSNFLPSAVNGLTFYQLWSQNLVRLRRIVKTDANGEAILRTQIRTLLSWFNEQWWSEFRVKFNG